MVYIKPKQSEPVAPNEAIANCRFESLDELQEAQAARYVAFRMIRSLCASTRSSIKTWKRDLEEKPIACSQIGVLEYYAFDPHDPPLPLSRRKGRCLFGWQRDAETGLMRQVSPRTDGALWGPELNSWLKPDGKYPRLYNALVGSDRPEVRWTRSKLDAKPSGRNGKRWRVKWKLNEQNRKGKEPRP